jgi:GH25 family lysozyme M1 (1,4-beta-N-acetylmuramidase)
MHHRRHIYRTLMTAAVAGVIAASTTIGSLPAASAAKVIKGPDVASYQHPHATKAHPHGQPISWAKVAKAGYSFAIVKATEGTTYVNPYFAGPYYDDYANSAAAGLVHGAYHFARPTTPVVSSAKAQAKFFAATVGPVTTKKTLPPALDLEVTGGLNPGQLVTWAQTFLLEMRTLTGRTPMLYTYPYFWEHDVNDPTALARYPLWMAEYGVSHGPVSDLWQYTDHAAIKGIVGAVDVSRFAGTSGFAWSVLSNGTAVTPWVSAAPAAPVEVKASGAGGAVKLSWLPGDTGTSPITSYQVTADPGGLVATVSGATLHATINHLSTTTAYTFTVTATNSTGTGVASTATQPVTPRIPTVLAAKVKGSLHYGASLPLKATLHRADTHAALPDKQVLLFRRESVSTPWVQVRKLSTNSAGLVTTLLRPKRSAQLEAVFPGGKGVARSEAFENYVVRPTVTAALSSTKINRGKHVTLTGKVSPFVRGTKVLREGLVGGRWQVWATTKLGPKGGFRFVIHPTAKSVDTYRIVVAAAHGRGKGISSRMQLTVD